MARYQREYDDYPCSDFDFQDPGGRSALRRATKRNPRIYPCPTCKEENRLTLADVRRHYQCDDCADRAEGRMFD
jgi:DNA-directed RNA polymerase subunit RPC12/RpoP